MDKCKNKKHYFSVNGLNSEDTCPLEILLINGAIQNPTPCSPAETQNSLKIIISELIDGVKKPFNDRCAIIYENGHYKAFLHFRLGKNFLELQYCCETIALTIIYEPLERLNAVVPLVVLFKDNDLVNFDMDAIFRKIIMSSLLAQCIFNFELFHLLKERWKTFQLDKVCQILFTSISYSDVNKNISSERLWEMIARELTATRFFNTNHKYLGFLSSIRSIKFSDFRGQGGGGLALVTTEHISKWPETIDELTSIYKNPCFLSSLGSIVHELCHTFDLGHTKKGLMSSNYCDEIAKIFDPIYQPKYLFNPGLPTDKQISFGSVSSSLLLGYHKWFNSNENSTNFVLSFDRKTNLVKSTLGIRVIELRSGSAQELDNQWVHPGRILTYSYILPETWQNYKSLSILIVEDNNGNIIKVPLN